MALLKDPESYVRSNAVLALDLLSALTDNIFLSFLLAMDSQSFIDLYSVGLRRSFSDHLTLCVEGTNVRINIPEGGREVLFG